MPNRLALGRWIRRRRGMLGLTQQQLADRAKCSFSLIRKLETGERAVTHEIAQHLAEALQVSGGQCAVFFEYALSGHTFAPEHPPWESAPVQHTLYRGRLPTLPTPLFGRENDVAWICGRLRNPTTRMLTLVGPPGVGKTRLAIAAAAHLEPSFRHGICFVTLAPLSDYRLVLPAIAHALGLHEQAGQNLEEMVTNFLYHRSMLLILDNYEHVIDARSTVTHIVQTCPHVHVLVTSREPLRLRAERRLVVEPLATIPAGELFLDRVQAVNPLFRHDDVDMHTVNAICSRLDRLPLAIE